MVCRIFIFALLFITGADLNALADETREDPADSLQVDSSSIIAPIDTTFVPNDSLWQQFDSAALAVQEQKKSPDGPLPPPVQLVDTLTEYFARHFHVFNVQDYDLYPRSGGGFITNEASYYALVYHETPLRTTVAPFGLNGPQMNIQYGNQEMITHDVTLPNDGRIDFEEYSTGDVDYSTVVEGPLSGYPSLTGGIAMLYMHPFEMPDGEAKSEFTVERGAYGYAYTRARVGRKWGNNYGFAFSTDYRDGDGVLFFSPADSYNIKGRLFARMYRKNIFEASIKAFRRKGQYPILVPNSFTYENRLRREQEAVISWTRQQIFGGQLRVNFDYHLSRTNYHIYDHKPLQCSGDISYLRSSSKGSVQLAVAGGKEKNDITGVYASRDYGNITLSGYINRFAGKIFVYARARGMEKENFVGDGAIGYVYKPNDSWKINVSAGINHRRPSLYEKYLADPATERKINGNFLIAYQTFKSELSLSVNAGHIDNVIYFDWTYDDNLNISTMPRNDVLKYSDINLSAGFDHLWWFYGKTSVTWRRVDSDRYGTRPPYSPRWQNYTLLGLRYYISRFDLTLRGFGEMEWTEKPLTYRLEERETYPIFGWGMNASMRTFTFYYRMHNASNRLQDVPDFYGYSGWFYSWGINWKFLD